MISRQEGIVRRGAGAAGLMLLAVVSAGAQVAPQTPQFREQVQGRFQIAVMEAALEQAVQLGATNINMQVQTLAPEMVFLSGAPRARGFRLRDYGIFFDVAVPVMRPSLSWTFQVLRRNDNANAMAALNSLRGKLGSVENAQLRQELERDVRRIERELPVMRAATAVADAPKSADNGKTASRVVSQEDVRAPGSSPVLDDPSQAYSEAVRTALINAMLEYSESIPLSSTEWLTIAVRSQEGSRRQSLDPVSAAVTVLRVRGSDLAAFHSRQINAEVARSRIEVTEE